MSDTFADNFSTSSSEYFSSDENDSQESLNMDFIKLKKRELKNFNVLFEKPDDNMDKYKKCMKCNEVFSYPHDYLNHCKNTYFRCCDNINIDTEKLSRDEARKYCKYLKNKNADCLNDINNFYKNTFKNVNTDAKIKQKLAQRDITIQNLRCQLEEEKKLRKSLINTMDKETNEKIKELTNHLDREIDRESTFQDLLILYNEKLEEAQQTIEEQKQLLTFYEAEKRSIHYGFNQVIKYNEDCSKDIKLVKEKKTTANKIKREKTEKKKKETTVKIEKEKPEKKLDTPPVSVPEKKEEVKEEKKEIVKTETVKVKCEKKLDTPPVFTTTKYKEYDTYTEEKNIDCVFNDILLINRLNDFEDAVYCKNDKVYFYNPVKDCDIKNYIIGSYIRQKDKVCIYINEYDKQHENIQKLIDDYGCFYQPDAHYFMDHHDYEFIDYVKNINKEENIMNSHEIDTANIMYYKIERE